jgi:hypothetical protein
MVPLRLRLVQRRQNFELLASHGRCTAPSLALPHAMITKRQASSPLSTSCGM